MRIYSISLGLNNVYVLNYRSTILIDGGPPNKWQLLRKGLEKVAIKPEEIQLLVLTHGHWDHIGSAAEIKNWTGADILMHHKEMKCLEASAQSAPPGVTRWGKLTAAFFQWMPKRFFRVLPAKLDIPLKNHPFSLVEYGIPGQILHTPGHSQGSVSVILESGEAFVGDMAMNQFPLTFSAGLPIYAEDLDALLESWRQLLNLGVKTIYPAHGAPFSSDVIQKELDKWL